jgi:hypothetical protein
MLITNILHTIKIIKKIPTCHGKSMEASPEIIYTEIQYTALLYSLVILIWGKE